MCKRQSVCKGEEGVQGRRLYKREVCAWERIVQGKGGYVQERGWLKGSVGYGRERVADMEMMQSKR